MHDLFLDLLAGLYKHFPCDWLERLRFHLFEYFETTCSLRGQVNSGKFQWFYTTMVICIEVGSLSLACVQLFPYFIIQEMRKSPWIGFRMAGLIYCVKVSFVVLLRLLNIHIVI